jgi:hypothetical protein
MLSPPQLTFEEAGKGNTEDYSNLRCRLFPALPFFSNTLGDNGFGCLFD